MGTIKEIKFKMISPEMVQKLSVMEVTTSDVYDVDAYPIDGGVMDPRLGVIDPGMRCKTCGEKMGDCPGHFGHIELARPIVNILYLKEVKTILTYTCKCGALLATKEDVAKKELKISSLAPMKVCPECGEKYEKIKLEKPSTFYRGKKALTSLEVREQFEKISDEDAKTLKIIGGRPEWMIVTLLLVPSVTTRPSITLENGDRSEDDLTHKLVDIIRINKRFADNLEIGAPDFIIEDLWELLQYHVSTYFNNEISSIPPARHRSGRALKTLSQRLKSKDGRFRHNLSGKRVNFSARTVVSPDPNISINEVGVPERIARELTVPVKVTKHNIKYLIEFIKNGPDKHPGANYVLMPEGIRKKILKDNKELILEEFKVGCVLERHMVDGDIVLFNRQPSLHRMSVMAHKVKVMPHKTFRINLCVCKPYNADFDGDEMNLHLPQTAEARAEAEELMLVEQNIRSPRFGGPIIGCDQDYLSGSYLITKKDTRFTKEDVAQILASAGMFVDLKKDTYTGRELYSFAIPKEISISYKSAVCKGDDASDDDFVVIKDGQIMQGAIDEKSIAPFKGKLLDAIDLECGHTEARIFLDRITRIISEVMARKGFTISIGDLDMPASVDKEIQSLIDKRFDKVEELIDKYEKNKIESSPGRTPEETVEDRIMFELNNITNDVQNIIKTNAKESGATIMANTGARGSIQNLAYMSGMIGQEAVRGRRIFRGFKGRTLSQFKKDDLTPLSHGFVRESFKQGIGPIGFFFEAMKGREGIMDSSLKTRVSGYLQRRLVNALQDIIVNPQIRAVDGTDSIVQFTAGEDGIDPSKSDRGTIDRELNI